MNLMSSRNLIIIFIVLSILDYFSTLAILSKGGLELNPIAATFFVSSSPILGGLIYKLLTILLIYFVKYFYIDIKMKEGSFRNILTIVNTIFLLAVLNNVFWAFYM